MLGMLICMLGFTRVIFIGNRSRKQGLSGFLIQKELKKTIVVVFNLHPKAKSCFKLVRKFRAHEFTAAAP